MVEANSVYQHGRYEKYLVVKVCVWCPTLCLFVCFVLFLLVCFSMQDRWTDNDRLAGQTSTTNDIDSHATNVDR